MGPAELEAGEQVRDRLGVAVVVAAGDLGEEVAEVGGGELDRGGAPLVDRRAGGLDVAGGGGWAAGSADNIDQTFTVNLSTEAPNGTWRLRIQDASQADTGYLNSWTLKL